MAKPDKKPLLVLGISAYHGDASACIMRDGVLVAAAEEERFRRIKHWAGFPSQTIRYCLREAGATVSDLTDVAISKNPSANLHKKILYAIRKRPNFKLIKDRVSHMSRVRDLRGELAKALDIDPQGIRATLHHVEHHRAHVASSFLVSPYEDAALMSIDALGDFLSAMTATGKGSTITPMESVSFPHSLGFLYTAGTQYLGFPKYGDEYKVMGLAAYGRPEFAEAFRKMISCRNGARFELNLKYFRHDSEGIEMTWDDCEPMIGRMYSAEWEKLLGPARKPGEESTERHAHMAASLQLVFEEVYFHLLNALAERTKHKTLCLAGGVVYNCVANGKIFEKTPFERVYMQSAAGDAGTAIGAAAYVTHSIHQQPRDFVMKHSYWGPGYSPEEIEKALAAADAVSSDAKARTERIPDEAELCRRTARALADGKVVGWYQGRMEWGPRALGNRSILVDPRRAEMKDVLNRRIKRREPFRPFAPSILAEATGDYFETNHPSPFMLMTYRVKPEKRNVIPAPTHVDGTGRLQTVAQDENPLYWKLIKAFEKETGVPVLLNTSFNENEPVVDTPAQALDCFLRTQMDVLVMGPFFLEKIIR